MFRLHKWLAVTAGAFILIWLASGMVMTLPLSGGRPPHESPLEPLDLQAVTVSPADAVTIATKARGAPLEVTAVTLRRLLTGVIYEVDAAPGGPYLIEARTGRILTITAELAEQIARTAVPGRRRSATIARLTSYDLTYTRGPLPVFVVTFEDDPTTLFHVSAADGTVRRSDRWSRLQAATEYLHTFGPLNLVPQGDAARQALLLLVGGVGIGAAGTGYYLALALRRRR